MRIAPKRRRENWLVSIAAVQHRQPAMPNSAAAMYARQRPRHWKMDGRKKLNKADVKLIKLNGKVLRFGFPESSAPERLIALAQDVSMEKAKAQQTLTKANQRLANHKQQHCQAMFTSRSRKAGERLSRRQDRDHLDRIARAVACLDPRLNG